MKKFVKLEMKINNKWKILMRIKANKQILWSLTKTLLFLLKITIAYLNDTNT